ncbi:MAG: potassium-transporting ATPase subunit KdpC [bacterium]
MDTTLQNVRRELRPLFAITVLLLLITTVAYPLAVTGIAQVVFHRQANGSFTEVNGSPVGSSLVGQNFTGDQYFQGRPSAAGAGYDAANSSGSNLGPTSAKFIEGIADDPATTDVDESFAGIDQRVESFRAANSLPDGEALPSDSVTASASGLDPHISPATARLQVARIAKARGVSEDQIRAFLDDHTESAFLGFIGQDRVNVLKVNIALDKKFPAAK